MILDSGDRRTFDSGATRDMNEDKGRCDLIPLVVMGTVLDDGIVESIAHFQKTNNTEHLLDALFWFVQSAYDGKVETMFLELAKHFAEGAKKYGEYNWQKGLPVNCYIDSAVRHYLKWRRGDQDEDHARAFCWNIVCCMWEVDHHLTEVEK